MGATTIWERWDGIKPDSSFQTPGMNSFNHYAYGAIGDWMYRVAAGLDTYEDGVGYKHIRIKPIVGGKFEFVKASLDTYYGKVSSAWKKESGRIVYSIVVPGNTMATVILNSGKSISCDGQSLDKLTDVKLISQKDGQVEIQVGSGTYQFEVSN
jgi:alpha-L-rhamnosidase